jgi:hypothetical protein
MSAPMAPHYQGQFEETGLQLAEGPFPEHLLRFLQAESARLLGQIDVPRPWHYAELHNPWGRAGAVYDCWGFLDICQSSMLVEIAATLIGPDIVLFDSQWLPDRWQALEAELTLQSDAHRFPIDPPHGLTILIGFAETIGDSACVDYQPLHRGRAAEQRTQLSLELEYGSVVFLDSQVPFCVRAPRKSNAPTVYAIRYFPSSSRYNRDPTDPVHRALTERYPLINYARLPLWLVHGEDHAGNDFVTGFNVRAGYWTNASW